MRSQPEILEPTLCEDGHGMMVPVDTAFAYAADGKNMDAQVEWRWSEDRGIYVCGYAVDGFSWESLLPGKVLGETIYGLQQQDKLARAYYVINNEEDYFRVDDNRPGHNHGYLIWLGKQPKRSGISFRPGTVYHWFEQDDQDTHDFPWLDNFDDIVSLMQHPSVLLIEDIGNLPVTTELDDPAVKAKWSLDDRVVVRD
jgi:hypothetical protein